MVCVDSVDSFSNQALSLSGRCFVYDSALQKLHNLTNQAFFSSPMNQNEIALYLFYDEDSSQWVFAEEVCSDCNHNDNPVLASWKTLENTLIFDLWHDWSSTENGTSTNSSSGLVNQGNSDRLFLSCHGMCTI